MKSKEIKKIINPRNIGIILCIIAIIISLYIILKPSNNGNIEQVSENIKTEQKEISEEDARKKAVEEFKKLNEEIKKEDLKVFDLERDGEMNFYIKSEKNTMEIRKKDGIIIRLNANRVNDN